MISHDSCVVNTYFEVLLTCKNVVTICFNQEP